MSQQSEPEKQQRILLRTARIDCKRQRGRVVIHTKQQKAQENGLWRANPSLQSPRPTGRRQQHPRIGHRSHGSSNHEKLDKNAGIAGGHDNGRPVDHGTLNQQGEATCLRRWKDVAEGWRRRVRAQHTGIAHGGHETRYHPAGHQVQCGDLSRLQFAVDHWTDHGEETVDGDGGDVVGDGGDEPLVDQYHVAPPFEGAGRVPLENEADSTGQFDAGVEDERTNGKAKDLDVDTVAERLEFGDGVDDDGVEADSQASEEELHGGPSPGLAEKLRGRLEPGWAGVSLCLLCQNEGYVGRHNLCSS